MSSKLLFTIIIISCSFILCDATFAFEDNSSYVNDNSTINEGPSYASTQLTTIKGYWINSGPDELHNIDITSLKNAGITDLFILTYKEDPDGTLKPFLDAFSGSGIRIHAWITCFKDQNGNMFDPDSNPDLMTNLTDKITFIAANYNIDGIHLDYVRYPGTAYQHPNSTTTVTNFVKNISIILKTLNQQAVPGKPYIYLSAALMPELGSNAYYYAQDYVQLSNYLDILIPMVYKGNYNQNPAWIGTCTSYIAQHANGKPVVIGLQTYRSDNNPVPIPLNELNTDIMTALSNGSSGYVLFKYGLVDNNYPGTPIYNSYTKEEIGAATSTLNDYINTNKKLPNYVSVGSNQITIPQYLSLLVNSLLKINTGDNTAVIIRNYRKPKIPIAGISSGNIYKTEYLELAKTIKLPMDTSGVAPGYINSSQGKIGYESLIYMYNRVINYYYVNKNLPSYVSIKTLGSSNTDTTPPTIINTNPINDATDVSLTTPVTITFNENIFSSSNFSGIYIKNLTTGNTVSLASKTINTNTLTITQSLSRLSNNTYQVYIPTSAVKDGAGNNLAAAYTYTFKTTGGNSSDTNPPTITSTSPSNNATGVTLTSPVTITFSENIIAGTNFSGIYIKNITTGNTVSLASKTINGTTLTIIQNLNRLVNCNYQLYIPAGAVKDAAGNSLATAYTLNFSTSPGTNDNTPPTVTSTNPADNSTGFSLTSALTITFSENIQSGANFSGIYIKNLTTGKTVTMGSKTISGNNLTIKQATNRLNKNTYQVYIPAGAVKDAAGNSLATDYKFTFKTA